MSSQANQPARANVSTKLLQEGELLGGRYKIECCLGGGGMASIYRAMHVGLHQPVAVKVVSPLIREVPGVASRFMREARAATRLKGEHVVRVFDVGTTNDGAPYLVMELLDGQDLGEMLDAGLKPSVEDAIDYVLQACEALAEVHGLGIVHRDLKPANLFVSRGPDGLACVKLIDFGISRIDSPLSPKEAIALTNPDVVMGSPRYMPPEQMESASSADSRSDIWGLGAILYEMLVGNAPFDGSSLLDIYAAAVRSPPTLPSEHNENVPHELDAVVLKCMRVDPSDRYVDVAELAMALAPFGNDGAAARADLILRVLDATRLRGQGDGHDRGPIEVGGSSSQSSASSRIRRRHSTESRTRLGRIAGFSALALLLVGIGVGARPIAARLNLSPSLSVTGAAAATAAATTATAPSARGTQDVPTTPSTPASIEKGAERHTTATTTTTGRAPVEVPVPAAPPGVPAETPAEPTAPVTPNTADLAALAVEPEPAPPPRVQAPRAHDDRALFEDRK